MAAKYVSWGFALEVRRSLSRLLELMGCCLEACGSSKDKLRVGLGTELSLRVPHSAWNHGSN
jgi:hypothetical protein